MINPRLSDFYTFAVYLHPIVELPPTVLTENSEAIQILTKAQIACSVFESDDFVKAFFPSAVRRAERLREFIEKDIFQSDDKGGMIHELHEDHVQHIREYVHAFETSFQDDARKLPVFICEDRKLGNLSIDKLLRGASHGYPLKIKMNLPDSCRLEIDESGKCLVFERSTAAAFHMLRAVELMIRHYLTSIPGFQMPPLNRQNWGEYLSLLKTNGAAKEVTDHLHNIKDNYRNPLMHPEDTLEMDEAVSLFGVAQSMNEMLVADMKKRGFIKCQT